MSAPEADPVRAFEERCTALLSLLFDVIEEAAKAARACIADNRPETAVDHFKAAEGARELADRFVGMKSEIDDAVKKARAEWEKARAASPPGA